MAPHHHHPPPSSLSRASSKLSVKKPPLSSSNNQQRPSPTVVTADPSNFRHVVQQLTGTAPSSIQYHPPPPPPSSRLRKFAPPPLKPHPPLFPLHEENLHHHRPKTKQNLSPLHLKPPQQPPQQPQPTHLINFPHHSLQPPNSNHRDTTTTINDICAFSSSQLDHSFSPPTLPMLSPGLLSALPTLTPRDNAWVDPLDAIPPLSTQLTTTLPSLLHNDSNGDNHPHKEMMNFPSPASRFRATFLSSPRFPLSPFPPISPGFFPPSPGIVLGSLCGGATCPNGTKNLGNF